MYVHLIAMAAVAALSTLPEPGTARPGAAQIVAAERDFAAAAAARGVTAAFRAYIAPDGIIFRPDPVAGAAILKQERDEPGAPVLRWWPVHAGISRSGDLGFTTGPWTVVRDGRPVIGEYFTVWRRQHDGSWRFVLDHGPRTGIDRFARDAPVTELPLAPHERGSAPRAFAQIVQLESRLAAAAAGDSRLFLAPALAEQVWLMRPGAAPAVGRTEALNQLQKDPSRLAFSRLGGGISKAVDLAYTYGDVSWRAAGGRRRGHYVRMWQAQRDGWKIVIDELVPAPPR